MASFRHFAWRLFVMSSFRVAFFRYFVISRCVISLFRLFGWRYFVILRGVISWQKDEKTKWHKSATIVGLIFLTV